MKLRGKITRAFTIGGFDKNFVLEVMGKFDYRKELSDIDTEKEYDIEIKVHRQRRSLDANAYLWVLLGEMAGVLRTNKDDLYLVMLERYGVFTHIIVKPHVVEKVKQEWRTVKVLGDVVVNGQTGVQLQCYFGSSTYDSKEFAILLDGVISEAKEMGINTATEDERDRMINEWGKKNETA